MLSARALIANWRTAVSLSSVASGERTMPDLLALVTATLVLRGCTVCDGFASDVWLAPEEDSAVVDFAVADVAPVFSPLDLYN